MSRPKNLPGDLTHEKLLERIIRVNHAGEYGATRICKGQLAILKKKEAEKAFLTHMEAQEEFHLEIFTKMAEERSIPVTRILPLWHVAGFGLGAVTALFGTKTAMTCTVAVEDAIEQHYNNQLEVLGGTEPDLSNFIMRFRDEEIEHRDTGLALKATEALGYKLWYKMIYKGCRVAIWLSERV